MHSTNTLYNQLLAAGAKVEYKLKLNGVDYGCPPVRSMSAVYQAFSEDMPTVGCCIGAQLDVVMDIPSATIPKGAQLTPYARLRSDKPYFWNVYTPTIITDTLPWRIFLYAEPNKDTICKGRLWKAATINDDGIITLSDWIEIQTSYALEEEEDSPIKNAIGAGYVWLKNGSEVYRINGVSLLYRESDYLSYNMWWKGNKASVSHGTEILRVEQSASEDQFPQDGIQDGYWYRYMGELGVSDWISKKTYWISTRDDRSIAGRMKIKAFDAMGKTEQSFLTGGDVGLWPQTDIDVVDEICERIGVTLDNGTRSILTAGYDIPLPAELTMREVLGRIGTFYCGNWVITDDNTLRLLQLGQALPGTGVSVTVASRFITAPTQPAYSMVRVYVSDQTTYESGTDTGAVLDVDCPWATQDIADDMLERISGYAYVPFEAGSAKLHPAVELGDAISIGDVSGILYRIEDDFRVSGKADIAAPHDGEPTEEFPYLTAERKAARRYAAANARLSIVMDEIRTEVTRATAAEGVLSSRITQAADSITSIVEEINANAQPWAANTYYSVGAVVYTGSGSSKVYHKCTTAHTSGLSFDASKWQDTTEQTYSKFIQSADSILAAVNDGYYGKQSLISIASNKVLIQSGGSFEVAAGASIIMSGNNFSISEGGDLSITGTLSAAKVYASNLVYAEQYGYIPSGAISDGNHSVDDLYVGNGSFNSLRAASGSMASLAIEINDKGSLRTMATIGSTGITPAGESLITWAEMRGGGTSRVAVFG